VVSIRASPWPGGSPETLRRRQHDWKAGERKLYCQHHNQPHRHSHPSIYPRACLELALPPTILHCTANPARILDSTPTRIARSSKVRVSRLDM
jgi:hypothetical protein